MVIGVGFVVTNNNKQVKPVEAAGDSTEYSLVNNVSALEAGKSYIITSGTSGSVKAISTESNANNRKTTTATVTSSKITRGSNIMSFTLGGSSGAWTFATENYLGEAGYLASAASGKNNYLRVISEAATATVSFSGNEAVINIGPHNERTKIRYNSTNDLFACYSSGQNAVYLWKETASKTLTNISVQTAPNKTTYAVGESFDPTGLIITRTYSDSTSDTYSYANHEGAFSFLPNLTTPLTVEDTSVSITYNEKSVSQPILVRTITAVELLGDMSNKIYKSADEWDLTGLYLSLTWNVGEPNPTTINLVDLTKDTDYLLDKDAASIGDTTLYIYGTYKGFEFNKTVTGITVSEKDIVDLVRSASTSLNHSSNSYASVSNVTKAGHSDIVSEATYAGYYYGATSPRLGAMQLNPSKSTYICTTSSSQLIKSVTVSFKDANNNGVKFFVSNTAYTASYNASGSASSVELDTLEENGTINIAGNYKYFYMVPTGTTYVDSISVEWKLAKEEIAATLKTKSSLAYSGYTDNGDGTFGYDNLAVRFTGYIEESLWDRLDDESKTNGYGILLSTTEYLNGQVEKELKNYYATADGINVKKFDNTDTVHEPALKAEPTLKNGYYVWNLFKPILLEDATKDYVAVAYIKLVSGEVLFLDDIEASVKKLAQDLIAGPERDENSLGGSLNYLANL